MPILGVVLIPALAALEQDWGLRALFMARGSLAPPEGVIVVGIDEESGDFLDRPGSRLRHAEVVDRLSRAGAALIVLDLFLNRESDEDDRLSVAFRDAGNVVVTARLDRDTQAAFDRQALLTPTPRLTSNLLAVAPWLVPEESRIDWVFVRDDADRFTLPFVVLQANVYEEFVELIDSSEPSVSERIPRTLDELTEMTLNEVMEELRATIRADEELADRLLARAGEADPGLRTLVETYADRQPVRQNRLFLNYYGGPRTVTTVSYDDLRADRLPDSARLFQNMVVFVGYSALSQPGQDDAHPYVYSRDGFRISGVEMGATAYANLRDGLALRQLPISASGVVAAVWGLLITFLLDRSRLWRGVGLGCAACLAYAATALVLFVLVNLWFPLVVPATQAVFAVGATLRVKQLRERAFLAVSTAEEAALALTGRGEATKVDYRVILHADEQDSKKWWRKVGSELDARKILELRAEFSRMRDDAVIANGGRINHLLADSMLAFWIAPKPDSRDLCGQVSAACNAALQVQAGVDAFNAAHPRFTLFVRVGLHSGRILSGLNPSSFIKDWRMEGQAIHAAERLESFNKVLGTRVLVSNEMAECLYPDKFWTPLLGTFVFCDELGEVLVDPIGVRELRYSAGIDEPQARAAEQLKNALRAIQSGDWNLAIETLDSSENEVGWGNLLAFYRVACAESAEEGSSSWRGVVKVTVSDKVQRLDRYFE